jgi:methylated-DNA-[protein]-cysteine S-methyltransferase
MAKDKDKSLSIHERVRRSTTITEFQRRVYMELLCVPQGETVTYGELARRIGCRSAQAVGQALKRNPFAPEVPCHRVVSSAGTLGGYFGSLEDEMLERKRQLIEAERTRK